VAKEDKAAGRQSPACTTHKGPRSSTGYVTSIFLTAIKWLDIFFKSLKQIKGMDHIY
jgi:hypothetical protein